MPDWPFVARDAELREAAQAVRGGSRGVVLAGKAGVGKSALSTLKSYSEAAKGSATYLVDMDLTGTSLADVERIHRCAARAAASRREGNDVVVVVSAMGQTTDELLDLAGKVCSHAPKREMDQLLASGETVSIALMAMALHEQGYDAISFTGPQINLLTDDAFTKARIQDRKSVV